MNRRTMLGVLAGAGMASAYLHRSLLADEPAQLPEPSARHLPEWHGFNLLEMFMAHNAQRFREEDFALIQELGFNFVRLPLDYRIWTDPNDWTKLREDRLEWLDEAVGFGRKHGIHVMLNFHRAPGYTVANPPEPKSLWTESEAQTVCAQHWGQFAKRFQGIPNRQLSFNLFNEPAHVGGDAYKAVVERMLEAIRKQDNDRLVVCDGRDWGNTAPTELVGLGVASATRGYAPFHLTHYRASWVQGADKWDKPTYPIQEGGKLWNRERLENDQVKPWKALEGQGVGVMVGEFGAHNQTPHDVVLNWMQDCLQTWKSAHWGWALWNFRGSFGILDSDRADVSYERFRGHQLDRAMLQILKKYA